MSDQIKPYVIDGERLEFLIINAHRLLRAKYRQTPLWAMVKDLLGHGSTVSSEICIQCGFDPHQNCGSKRLKRMEAKL